MADYSYLLGTGKETRHFDNAADAGAAFYETDASLRPFVVQENVHGKGRFFAQTELRGAQDDGSPHYVKTFADDHIEGAAEFRAGYERAKAKPEQPKSQSDNTIAQSIKQQDKPIQQELPASGTAENFRARENDEEAATKTGYRVMPDNIASRYLKVDDKYYFNDETVAFEDRGNKLKLETENREVIRDALAIVETRGWDAIAITGSDNFKAQVWHEASLKGIEVQGYTPSEFEVAKLNQALEQSQAKEYGHEQHQNATPQDKADDTITKGVLLAHGKAHYLKDQNKSLSYYATVAVNGQEITRWGVDLERAYEQSASKPEIGDTVVLKQTGRQDVEIKEPGTDAQGNTIEESKLVKRNGWLFENAAHYDQMQERAEQIRAGSEIEYRVTSNNPELAAAIAVSKLGEKIAEQIYAKGIIKSEDEKNLMVSVINQELAKAIEDGKTIKTPEIKEAAKQAVQTANDISNDHIPQKAVTHAGHERVR